MLCDVCTGMLNQQKGLIWTGTLTPIAFEHHKSTKTLRQSLIAHCVICAGIARLLRSDTDLQKDQPVAIRADLEKLPRKHNDLGGSTFALVFGLGKNRSRTFLLTEIGKSNDRDCGTRY
jgi:hypothetical protein